MTSRRILLLVGPLLFILLIALWLWPRAKATPAGTVQALKILVAEDGFYRLTIRQLQISGLAIDQLHPENLHLSQLGQEVPFFIAENEALIFYGQAPAGRYSHTRPYILRLNEPGRIIPTTAMPTLTAPRLSHIPTQIHLEENWQYVSDAQLPPGDEPWFWQMVRNTTAIPLELDNVGDGSGQLTIRLYGTTYNPAVEGDHSLALLVNDQEIGQIIWDGQTAYTATLDIPAGTLQNGPNNLTLQNIPEDYLDFSQLDWLDLTYQALPHTDQDWLTIANSEGQLHVTGFDSQPLVFEISDPAGPQQLSSGSYREGQLTLNLTADQTIAIVGPTGYRPPQAILPLRQTAWRENSQQADLLIITTEALAPNLAPLVTARQEAGLTVALVPVEAIYDEFGFGEAGPQAIQNFVTYVYHEWQDPDPAYLLLVGDASSDFKGYLATRPDSPVSLPANIIPPYLVKVSYSGETVSDARLADVNGDNVPELAVGRWPVSDPQIVADLVARTLQYEAETAPGRAIFAADGTESQFVTLANQLAQTANIEATVLNGPSAGEVAADWNAGAWLVTYIGHGSLELWGKEEIFSTASVNQLQSEKSWPIVLQLTCLSGLFAHPEIQSLSETLISNENGPVLLVGATSLTLSSSQEPFANAFLQAIQAGDVTHIGDAFQQAKQTLDVNRLDLLEISDTFSLFGDPSAVIKRP